MTIHSSSLTAAQPIVSVKDGKVFANSRDVAEFFGKEHKNVLADIRELCSQLTAENSAVSFAPTLYPQKTGFGYRPMPAFDMTRDGFTLLAIGFTGKKALQFKLQYIEAFNRMEAKFKTAQPVPADNHGLLMELVSQQTETNRLRRRSLASCI